MFFDNIDEITKISGRTGCAIFVLPDEIEFDIPGALRLQPVEKSIITIEQVRDVIARLNVKQLAKQYIIIRPAELLGDEAANAFLKNLEEPQEKVHFVLMTSQPSKIIPTVLSRAEIYFLRTRDAIDAGVTADESIKKIAKRLIVARPADLVGLAEEITKKKDNVRTYALSVLGIAIEMLFKSYFLTQKDVFVNKLPKFLTAYESIEKNGHIKLHLVADLC